MKCEISPWLRAKWLKSLIRRPLLTLYSLDGEFQGKQLRILLADDGATLGYFRRLAFPNGSTLSRKGVISALRAPELCRSDADLVVVGANHLLTPRYAAYGFSLAPRFVRLRLFVYDSPDAMIDKLDIAARHDLRRNVRRMMEKGFTCELTNDDRWLDLFYYDMYKPYAENRHGELARVHSYRAIRKVFRRGAGLSIKREGQPVAGSLVDMHDGILFHPCGGILHGDQALARDGASVALYYYSIQLAHSQGCKTADFGYSPPFTSDGALSYKLKWGMGVVDCDNSLGLYAIAAPGNSEAAVEFLRANRFYCLTARGIELCDEL
ncbi:MAG: GNAT family N-acetyltransferase [Armatimonadota bacterium]|nr:GNAT family N-acetyltransferase [Armatimonadota bacterium]